MADDARARRRPRPADDGAVGRPGGAGRPRRAAARRATTSSCSTSRRTTSTSTGSTASRSSSRGLRRRCGRRQPRPRVPRPHGHPVVEIDLAPAAGRASTAAATTPTSTSARSRGGTRARRTRSTPTRAATLEDRARTQRAWMEKGVRNARRKAHRQRQDRPQASAPRPTEKQAAKARQTERRIERLEVVEEPRKEWELQIDDRRGAALGRGRRAGCAARSCGAARSRSARSTCSSTGPTGSRSPGPNGVGQVDAARARCSAASPLDAGTRRARARACVVGEVDQARGAVRRRRAAGRARSATRGPGLARRRRPHAARQVRARRDHVRPPGRRRCRPASAPGPRSRCCRRAGVNLLVLDEPTNHLDLPAIEQLEQRSSPSTARCCSSRTTAACSTPSRPTGASTSTTGRCASADPGARPEHRSRPGPRRARRCYLRR